MSAPAAAHGPGRPGNRRRWATIVVVLAPILAACAIAVLLIRPDPAPAEAPALPPATATVVRATLTETETIDGALGYGTPEPLVNRLSGTVTSTATAGSVIGRGQVLYSVDQRPVVLLFGPVPAYRALAAGMTGDDVRQLEENLRELGYTGFTVDGTYTAGTAAAVARWQRDLRLPATSEIELGTVVFLPSAVRIAGIAIRAGQVARPEATALSHTGTDRLVTAGVDAYQLPMVTVGSPATVTLPGRVEVAATVLDVGSVAAAGEAGQPSDAVGQSTGAESAAFTVTFSITDQRALGGIDGAPVTVALVGRQRADVLAVPVAALLALREGGYGVQVVDGSAARIVAVEVGLFADGLVEISGPGISEGTVVGMPAP